MSRTTSRQDVKHGGYTSTAVVVDLVVIIHPRRGGKVVALVNVSRDEML